MFQYIYQKGERSGTLVCLIIHTVNSVLGRACTHVAYMRVTMSRMYCVQVVCGESRRAPVCHFRTKRIAYNITFSH
jgi:hypothetical protein